MIEHGHNFKDIKEYSLEQIILFFNACTKAEALKRAEQIENICIGFNGGEKAGEITEKLRSFGTGTNQENQQVASPQEVKQLMQMFGQQGR